jgi:UDP:flavonoid glycosyltransferase YjiC (YdhE family)
MRWMLKPAQELAARRIHDALGIRTDLLFMDWPMHSDGVLQMTCPGFEYPRAELPAPLHFVGPTTVSQRSEHPLPPWWDDLDGSRPVVHVTQGTVANDDLSRLVEPAIAALAGEDVLVVVTTCGGTLRADTPLPSNVRVAEFLPYDELLPRCAVMVSNGGYGGVNHALRYGVPLVAVGASEDKREVVARVTWSGAGLGYARNSLPQRKLRRAVHSVLTEPRYRDRAGQLAAEIATGPTMDDVLKLITSD